MNQTEINQAQRVIYLVNQYRNSSITELENVELELWLQLKPTHQDLFSELLSSSEKDSALEIMNSYSVNASYESLRKVMLEEARVSKMRTLYQWMATAAAILIVVSTGVYFYSSNHTENKETHSLATLHDVPPGGNRAMLTLSDGSTVDLSNDRNGIVVGDDEISYNDGSFVIQSDSEGSLPAKQYVAQMLALTTPRGGQYQITLSDGTKVWLNAGSKLTYPSKFIEKERIVELIGEAYFEVAKNSKQPFVVKSIDQEVTVLGTHFNVNAYVDELTTKTTLLEGAVRVSSPFATQILEPNQQSIISKSSESIKVATVNPQAIIDWKNGDFIFNSDIKTIMRQIARWYNVEVTYEGNMTNEEFGGTVSRRKSLQEVLNVLQGTNRISFKLEESGDKSSEGRVIVMPSK